jgi:erythromycin esterase-like protein
MASLRGSIGLVVIAACACLGEPFAFGAGPAAGKTPQISDADVVVHELCGKRIALLGESPSHGYGRTMQFKAELVRRLIDECRYNAFFIESGIYDFLNLRKKLKSGQEVTEPMIAAAIGGLWAAREVEPLIPFLLENARAGKVVLGGLDDQLGRGTYAQRAMSSDLVEYLHGDSKAQCLAILRKHTLWQYDTKSPYSPKDKALIVGCLDSVQTAVSKAQSGAAPFREYDLAMVESLKRSFARDFPQDGRPGVDPAIQNSNARDESMYLNFRWLMSRLPAHSKVIVWGATTHMAKDLSRVPGLERSVSMGSFIHREFKTQSFALGFSAYSGSYGIVRQSVRQLSAAPGNSLEGRAFANHNSDTCYFSSSQIRKLGPVPARPLGSAFQTARWDEVLDGILLFREERPPTPGRQ